MNKLSIFTTITITGLLTPFFAFADINNNCYLRINAGANWMQKIVDRDETTTPCLSLTCKSKAAPIFMIGGGYNLNDRVRADLTFETVTNPTLSGSTTANDLKYTGKHKGNIKALMLNSYIDLFDAKVAGIFAGVGLGVARVKETLSGSVTNQEGETNGFSVPTKAKTNLAYQLTLGAERQITPNIKAELSYSWRDYGKSGALKGEAGASAKSHFKGHNVLVGLRFDL